ncbi:MAG: putative manganese transporter [Bacteroidia bacterium]|nr:putative manganese transporter [Bacteroidia bacterium]
MDWSALAEILKESLVITAVVTAMMMLIEYVSYRSEGRLVPLLRRSKVGGVVSAAILGVIPGCLGGYITVSMYSKRVFSFSALLSMMIATTGDEAFVMLAMYPGTAAAIFAGLFTLAIAVGLACEKFESGRSARAVREEETEKPCGCTEEAEEKTGKLCGCAEDAQEKSWTEAPSDTCLHSEAEGKGLRHRMKHTLGEALKIFAWAFGVLLAVKLASGYVDLETLIGGNAALMIPLAVLIGLIPQSGPHLVFVTLFAQGIVPLPVLLASCISQDGHAGLPLLAEDRRSFLRVKAVKCVLALAAGYLFLLF